MKKNKPRKRKIKAVSKEEVTLGIVTLPAPTVALHPNWGHPYPIPAFWECSLAVPQLCCHPSLQGSRLSRPGPSRSLPKEQPSQAELIIFRLYLLKATKSRRAGERGRHVAPIIYISVTALCTYFKLALQKPFIKWCKALL